MPKDSLHRLIKRLALALLLHGLAQGAWAQVTARQQELNLLLKLLPPTSTKITGRINAQDKTWEEWARRTGELPPDFAAMKASAALPDPLRDGESGQAVTNAADWQRQKQWIRAQYERWLIGRMPPAPGNLRAVVTDSRREGGVTVRDVRLEFGPAHQATLRLQLLIPDGSGPFPVFLTNHPRTRPWVNTAVRRGYLACIYYAADPVYGQDDDSDQFIDVYPEYDFSCLARWAWAGMRAVDYLYTLPEVDRQRIAITGHSRNGKQALIAAAFDERIRAVALSSGNTGEGTPWRYATDAFQNESIEQITTSFPHWFHPRLRFFVGREDKLPVDQNSLLALVAPRGLLMASSYSETQGAPFGFEQAYRSVKPVYEFLGAPGKIGLALRAGEHPTVAEDIEQYLDFFDTVFGRRQFATPETWILGYHYADWLKLSGERVDALSFPARDGDWMRGAAQSAATWTVARRDLRARALWALGEAPPAVRFPAATTLKPSVMTSEGWLALLYNRPLKNAAFGYAPLAFGDDLKGDLYYPLAADGQPQPGKWPVVIWLHPYSHSTGYSRNATPAFAALTKRGFAVLAFDQIGFGTRIHQQRRFYERYPHWSLLGKMVADTQAAVDALAALDRVDAGRIYLVGSALGAKVALWTAALDERVKGIGLMGGVERLREAHPETEGLRHYSHLHGLLPRFGFFVGHAARLPIDEEEILALVAPRPVYLLVPEFDRYAPAADVRRAAQAVARAYQLSGQPEALTLDTPADFHRFPLATQERLFDWLARLKPMP